jgi:hypothetical protein
MRRARLLAHEFRAEVKLTQNTNDCSAERDLFKLEAAVKTFIRVFDQQKQKGKQAGERSANDGNQYRP